MCLLSLINIKPITREKIALSDIQYVYIFIQHFHRCNMSMFLRMQCLESVNQEHKFHCQNISCDLNKFVFIVTKPTFKLNKYYNENNFIQVTSTVSLTEPISSIHTFFTLVSIISYNNST